MVEPRELLTGTLLYGTTEIVNRALPFLLLPVFTAYLSPSDFGISAIIATMSVFLTPIFSLGLGASTAPCYFSQEERSQRLATIDTALFIVGGSCLALLVATTMFADWISLLSFGRRGFRRFVILGAVSTAFSMMTVPLRQYFQFERRAGLYVSLSSAAAAASVLTSVTLVVFLNRGVNGFIEGAMFSQAITWVLFAAAYAPRFRARFNGELARRLLRVGVPLIPAFAALFVLQHAGKYVLQWTRGLDEVGLFSVGFNIGLALSVIVTGFQAAWVPFFMSYAERRDQAARVLGRTTTYFVYAIGGASLLMYAAARPAILLLTTAQFQASWRVVGLSATAQFLNGVFIVLLPGMYYANEVEYVGLIQGVAAIAGLILNWYLVHAYGFLGAAIAIVISYLLLALLTHFWNRYRGYVRVHYESRRLTIFSAFYIAAAGILSIDRRTSLLAELVMAAGAVGAFAAFMSTQIRRDERTALWSMVRAVSVPVEAAGSIGRALSKDAS